MFDVVQSVDRLDAGLALAKAARALGRRLRVLVQINISPAERFGVAPAERRALAARLREEGLDGRRRDGDRAARGRRRRGVRDGARRRSRPSAARRSRSGCRAIGSARAGSTMMRIGTAIFGPRAREREERGMSMFAQDRFVVRDPRRGRGRALRAPTRSARSATSSRSATPRRAARQLGSGVRAALVRRRHGDRGRAARAASRDREPAGRRPQPAPARRRLHVRRRLHDRRPDPEARRGDLLVVPAGVTSTRPACANSSTTTALLGHQGSALMAKITDRRYPAQDVQEESCRATTARRRPVSRRDHRDARRRGAGARRARSRDRRPARAHLALQSDGRVAAVDAAARAANGRRSEGRAHKEADLIKQEARLRREREIASLGDRIDEARREYQRVLETAEKAKSEMRGC